MPDTPTPEQVDRLLDAIDEHARIENVWLADSWSYDDGEAGVFANVMYHRTAAAPEGKPWRLYVARGERVGLADETWYATADEAKEALSAAVLDMRLRQAKA